VNVVLWILQVLLAFLFLFAGGTKLVMSIEEMTKDAPVHLPGLFLRFIGVCEVLGAFGLLLPALLRIKAGLTPLAAVGLAIITFGATVTSLMAGMVGAALLPFIVALLCVFVAYGRWRVAPIPSR
jgi:uncharacterized membrane protein YphA (DoxX/SURF4 family)